MQALWRNRQEILDRDKGRYVYYYNRLGVVMRNINSIKGTPPPVMLEAKSWVWRHISGPHAIDVPMSTIESTEEGGHINQVAEFDVADDISVHLDFSAAATSLTIGTAKRKIIITTIKIVFERNIIIPLSIIESSSILTKPCNDKENLS